MLNKTRVFVFGIFLLALVMTACGTQLSEPVTSAPPTQATPTTLPAASISENNGEGGAEAALVTYADAAQGFSIGHPGTWTQDTSFTPGVKFVGGDDWMTLAFFTPPTGTDTMAFATNNVSTVTAAFPGFAQLSLAASTEVRGAIVLGFTANGTSAVTGKFFNAHNEIYYIPLADGRVAILTVVGPDNHYDREAIRDIALTLNVTR